MGVELEKRDAPAPPISMLGEQKCTRGYVPSGQKFSTLADTRFPFPNIEIGGAGERPGQFNLNAHKFYCAQSYTALMLNIGHLRSEISAIFPLNYTFTSLPGTFEEIMYRSEISLIFSLKHTFTSFLGTFVRGDV